MECKKRRLADDLLHNCDNQTSKPVTGVMAICAIIEIDFFNSGCRFKHSMPNDKPLYNWRLVFTIILIGNKVGNILDCLLQIFKYIY